MMMMMMHACVNVFLNRVAGYAVTPADVLIC